MFVKQFSYDELILAKFSGFVKLFKEQSIQKEPA